MFELLLLPLIAGLAVALIAGPLGSFTVWRGMAYFGDTLAHSALLGVAAALLFEFNVQAGILICCLALALVLLFLQNKSRMSTDSLLGILSHASLALGLVLLSVIPGTGVDLFSYLFGDLLTVTQKDCFVIVGLVFFSLAVVVYFWRSLLMISIDEDLAEAEGISVKKIRLILMLLLALVIAVSMKTVGVLLITALLIIPAAAAQRITRSPEAMAITACILAVISVLGGVFTSALFDTPTGPSIVVNAAFLFLLSSFYSQLR